MVRLTSIIESNCLHFVTVPLCDTCVVVTAHDFVQQLRREHKEANGYGISSFEVANLFKKAVDTILKCNIQPVFIFDGVQNRIGIEWYTRLDCHFALKQKMLKDITLKSSPSNYHCKYGKFAVHSTVLMSVLDSLRVKYICSIGCLTSIAAAVAILLDCPLLGSSSDNYIICYNSDCSSNDLSSKLQFIPISGVSFLPIERAPQDISKDSDSVYFLRAHLYIPSESIMKNLPPASCRIFGLLLENLSTPRLKFPSEIDNAGVDYGEQLNGEKEKNAYKLASWIRDVGPEVAIQSVVNLIEDPDIKSSVSRCILESISRTQLDVKEAFLILQDLNCVTSSSEFLNETFSNLVSTKIDRSQSFSSLTSSIRLSESLLSHWPERMLKAYRFGLVCPFLLSSLYCEGGTFFPCNLDYIIDLSSSYLKALNLRYLNYCLMYSFEMQFGDVNLLRGLQPHLIELHAVSLSKIKVLFLTLEHIKLPNVEEKQLSADFVYDTFSFKPDERISPWLNSFALCLSIWFTEKSKEREHGNCCKPGECPLILAACVCAVASYFNLSVDWDTICEHYKKVANKAEEETAQQSPVGNHLLDADSWIIHSLTELQNVYTELVILKNYIKAITFFNSTENDFPQHNQMFPDHYVFPSNELFFWLTKCLSNYPPESRTKIAIRVWLPRLFIQSFELGISEKCVAVVADISVVIQLLNQAKIDIPKIDKIFSTLPLTTIQKETKELFHPQKMLENLFSTAASTPITKIQSCPMLTAGNEILISEGIASPQRKSEYRAMAGGDSVDEPHPAEAIHNYKFSSSRNTYNQYLSEDSWKNSSRFSQSGDDIQNDRPRISETNWGTGSKNTKWSRPQTKYSYANRLKQRMAEV